MGGKFSICKNNKKKVNSSGTTSAPPKRSQQMVLRKNRKIIQKDKELYKVVFEADGFSVHDLALLGQRASTETVIKAKLVPRHMGPVEIIPDISQLIATTKKPKKGEIKKLRSMDKFMKSKLCDVVDDDFEIVEIRDYIDNLYLQQLEPQLQSAAEGKDTTTTTTTTTTNSHKQK